MYVPPHYSQTDQSTLFQFIDDHPFGLLISKQDGLTVATHLPFLLDRTAGNGVLLAHVARQNPQWEQMANQSVLAIFHGPHAYVSPTWYQSEKVVPTWNYVAVHAYGPTELIEEPAALIELVRELTRVSEQAMPAPWTFDPADQFVHKLAAQIVGFR